MKSLSAECWHFQNSNIISLSATGGWFRKDAKDRVSLGEPVPYIFPRRCFLLGLQRTKPGPGVVWLDGGRRNAGGARGTVCHPLLPGLHDDSGPQGAPLRLARRLCLPWQLLSLRRFPILHFCHSHPLGSTLSYFGLRLNQGFQVQTFGVGQYYRVVLS